MLKQRKYRWEDGKELVMADSTIVMGILNGTPDSFSDGGKYDTADTASTHLHELLEYGADIIDFGVESTRPGFEHITVEEEIRRMETLLPRVIAETTVPVSVDTYRARTAEYAFQQGAHILNDIWGFHYDKELADVAASFRVPVILMHNQQDTKYDDIIDDMKAFFFQSIDLAEKAGVHRYNIWLDPGIGFGKNYEQNIEVIHRLDELAAFEFPILLGPSRKRFIGTMLNDVPPSERDEGTAAVCILGVLSGADAVRVHNVKMVKRALTVSDILLRGV